MNRHSPKISLVPLSKLRPTQMTVGMLEVQKKAETWLTLSKKTRQETLLSHCFPAILGPDEQHYIVDHHHLGLALIEHNVEAVWINVLRDLSWLRGEEFWRAMEHFQWAHPFDSKGERQPYKLMPRSLKGLKDDPYRSLAGELRMNGGYSKEVSPFSEFLWADHLRTRISKTLVVKDFQKALAKAKGLAHSREASYLPGWSGEFTPH